MPSKIGRRPKRLLILFGFLMGAIIAEVCLRIAGYSYPEFYTTDPSRGYALRPGMEGWYRREGEVYVRINSEGLRDREHTKGKPEDTVRIALLGDSYCEGLQVPLEETFWAVLERKLQSCRMFAGKKIEIINFGVSGYGTAQQLITLRDKVWNYSPDIVMLAITTNNDITDNSPRLRQKIQTPYFIYRDGKLVLDDSFKSARGFRFSQSPPGQIAGWVRNHVRVVQALSHASRGTRLLLASWKARKDPRNSPQPAENIQRAEFLERSQELGADNLVYLAPTDSVWNDAWHVTEGLILKMRDEIREKGGRFLVVTLSNGPQVLPDPSSREQFMKRFGINNLFYPDNRIKAFGENRGITIITLAPELQAQAERNKLFLHGFGEDIGNGHWNRTGHRVAGELLSQKLCQEVFSH